MDTWKRLTLRPLSGFELLFSWGTVTSFQLPGFIMHDTAVLVTTHHSDTLPGPYMPFLLLLLTWQASEWDRFAIHVGSHKMVVLQADIRDPSITTVSSTMHRNALGTCTSMAFLVYVSRTGDLRRVTSRKKNHQVSKTTAGIRTCVHQRLICDPALAKTKKRPTFLAGTCKTLHWKAARA